MIFAFTSQFQIYLQYLCAHFAYCFRCGYVEALVGTFNQESRGFLRDIVKSSRTIVWSSSQVAGLEEVMGSLAILTQAMVARGQAEVADWAAVARDLGTVTNQPLMLRSDKDKDLYYAVAKEVAETSRHHDNYP